MHCVRGKHSTLACKQLQATITCRTTQLRRHKLAGKMPQACPSGLRSLLTTVKAPSLYCIASMMYQSMVPMVKTPMTGLPPSPAATSNDGSRAAATRPLYLKGPGENLIPVDGVDMPSAVPPLSSCQLDKDQGLGRQTACTQCCTCLL